MRPAACQGCASVPASYNVNSRRSQNVSTNTAPFWFLGCLLLMGMTSVSAIVASLVLFFLPDIDLRLCKFIWLGTHQKFDDAFTFIFENI